MNNYLSLLFAYYNTGQYQTFPLFEDLSISNIIYIRQLNLPNAEGTLVNSFLIVAQTEKSVYPSTYYVQTGSFYPTLASLVSALNAVSTANSFTLYTGLLSIDSFTVQGDFNGNIIINDLWSQKRKYNVDLGQTFITTDIKQSIYYTQIVVDGDQTTAGDYYYNTYLPSL